MLECPISCFRFRVFIQEPQVLFQEPSELDVAVEVIGTEFNHVFRSPQFRGRGRIACKSERLNSSPQFLKERLQTSRFMPQCCPAANARVGDSWTSPELTAPRTPKPRSASVAAKGFSPHYP